MRKVLAVFGQFLLFVFVDGVGSLFFHPFGIQTNLAEAGVAPRSFVWDGLLLMLIVYLICLVIQTLRGRLRLALPSVTLALALAALTGYSLRFGFITHNW